MPSPIVGERRIRRQFTAAEKLRILRAADGCTRRGELGALLRREGIRSSHLCQWRKARASAELAALAPRRRGPPRRKLPQDSRVARLERENARLRDRLSRLARSGSGVKSGAPAQ